MQGRQRGGKQQHFSVRTALKVRTIFINLCFGSGNLVIHHRVVLTLGCHLFSAVVLLPNIVCNEMVCICGKVRSHIPVFGFPHSHLIRSIKLATTIYRKSGSSKTSAHCRQHILPPRSASTPGCSLQIQSETRRQPVNSHGQEYLMLCYFFQ